MLQGEGWGLLFFFFFGYFLDGCFFSRYFVWMCVSQSQTTILQFLFCLICSYIKCCMCQGTAWVMFVFKNILIMLGTQLSSDCENKYLSLQHAPSSNWILYHHPLTHTHKPPCDLYAIWCFSAGRCGEPGCALGAVGDSSAHPSCCALIWERLCAEEWRAACLSQGSEWLDELCAPEHVCLQTRNARLFCTFLKERLHVQRSSKQPYLCTSLVRLIKVKS